MTKLIFEEWMIKLNNDFKKENRKVLMLLDNCSSHVDLELSNIEIFFFPPNTTSIIQPLDQGIIKLLKDNYRFSIHYIHNNFRRMMLTRLVDCNENLTNEIKNIDLVDVFIGWSYLGNKPLKQQYRNVLRMIFFNKRFICLKHNYVEVKNKIQRDEEIVNTVAKEIINFKKNYSDLTNEEEKIINIMPKYHNKTFLIFLHS